MDDSLSTGAVVMLICGVGLLYGGLIYYISRVINGEK
ncbi:MAG TPA: MetS family NSS transporter small subunit [Peptostreptococcaceae bacterium]|nr:MetS family NSS transporter small subunit [Peptostreptococcaceae bacterium]